ncbi:hypothetical protein [Aureimonas mangrovi]|uniref:hypothetical protein n=1 Tax=Aureimonas mangrovi TaxID=2758041 RepID=UPI001AEE1994|nr:hypothetical protein [Aureimonas mangrovi]
MKDLLQRIENEVRSRSSLVGPGRKPSSRSVWRPQLRSISPEQPIFDEIDWIAAH